MMKTTIFIVLIATAGFSMQAISETVQSLRGINPIEQDTNVPTARRFVDDDEVIARHHVQQPPMVPHSIRGYRINLNENRCMTCHSWANHREANATKVSLTHFEDRDGFVMANVSPSRYFCTKCHAPQADARPLIENTFEPVRGFTGR